MDLIKSIARTWAQYRKFHASLAELRACSDRQLEDMGFTRGDLVRVAYEAAELNRPVAARAARAHRTPDRAWGKPAPAAG
jgi:uncharacterized protein YjiS (DUF1127 family)